MADFTIDTEELRRAAEQLRRAAGLVEPRSAETTVGHAALASDSVSGALNSATVQQGGRARSLARKLTSLSTTVSNGADALEQQDQDLADRLGD